jgi:hypothetical protein
LTGSALVTSFLFEGLIEGVLNLFGAFGGVLESHLPFEVLCMRLSDPSVKCLPWLEWVEMGGSDDGLHKSRLETCFEDFYSSPLIQVNLCNFGKSFEFYDVVVKAVSLFETCEVLVGFLLLISIGEGLIEAVFKNLPMQFGGFWYSACNSISEFLKFILLPGVDSISFNECEGSENSAKGVGHDSMVSVELLVKLKGEEESFAFLPITIEDDWGVALKSTIGINDVNFGGWSSGNRSNFFTLRCHWWMGRCCW